MSDRATPGTDDEERAGRPATAEGPGDDAFTSGTRERDPGDAVPPGVAPLEPPEPTEEDRRVLEKLRDLPNRG